MVDPLARRKHHTTGIRQRCIIYAMHTSTPRRDTIAPLLARTPLLATLHDYARVTLMDDGGATISLRDFLASRGPAVADPPPSMSAETLPLSREPARTRTYAPTMRPSAGDEVGHKVEASGTRNDAIDEHKRDARDTAAAPPAAPAPAPAQCRLVRQAAARWRQLPATARVIEVARRSPLVVSKRTQSFRACHDDFVR